MRTGSLSRGLRPPSQNTASDSSTASSDNPNWTCASETGLPDRTNLERAYINGPRASLNVNDDHIYLDLAWVREAAVDAVGFFQFEPEAHVAMEFNQELLNNVVLTVPPRPVASSGQKATCWSPGT